MHVMHQSALEALRPMVTANKDGQQNIPELGSTLPTWPRRGGRPPARPSPSPASPQSAAKNTIQNNAACKKHAISVIITSPLMLPWLRAVITRRRASIQDQSPRAACSRPMGRRRKQVARSRQELFPASCHGCFISPSSSLLGWHWRDRTSFPKSRDGLRSNAHAGTTGP